MFLFYRVLLYLGLHDFYNHKAAKPHNRINDSNNFSAVPYINIQARNYLLATESVDSVGMTRFLNFDLKALLNVLEVELEKGMKWHFRTKFFSS